MKYKIRLRITDACELGEFITVDNLMERGVAKSDRLWENAEINSVLNECGTNFVVEPFSLVNDRKMHDGFVCFTFVVVGDGPFPVNDFAEKFRGRIMSVEVAK